MKKSLITLLIICLFVPTILLGQTNTHISGIIRNVSGNGVADVNVYVSRVEQKYSVFASCLSGTDGSFTLSFKAPVDSICINVSGLNITPTSVICDNKSQNRDIIVDEKAQEIDEVVVRAPKIYSKGDTISYYVASFQSKNDISIGQVLRRLPGITVSDAGQISYKGQPIKNFYIEGLDLMKGRYGIATNNIDPNSISTIEVLENHQDIKALKDLKPEERASINLKLKSGVKGVFNLIATLGGGYVDKLLWDNELITTYFQRNSQLLATYKGNNSGTDLESELRSIAEMNKDLSELPFWNNPNFERVARYILMHSPYAYMDYNELLFNSQQERKELPTGTCLPFTKKIFVTVSGKIMPCEKISYKYQLGTIKDQKVNIDFEAIAQMYNSYYDRVRQTCRKCFNHKGCLCCIFNNGQLESHFARCSYFVTSIDNKSMQMEVNDFLRKYPEAYSYIMQQYEVIL